MNESNADKELAKYKKVLTIHFQGKEYPLWVLMEYLEFVVTKDGKYVPFRLNAQQIKLYAEICEMVMKKEPVRINILKARQEGISTFIAYMFSLLAFYNSNIRIGIVADSKEHAEELFSKYQYVYDHLDDRNPAKEQIDNEPEKYKKYSWKPTLKYAQGKKLMATRAGNSSIEVMVVGESSGRSKRFDYLHLSEVAFWGALSSTLTSLLQTVSNKSLKSMIFFETTANGFNGYKTRWDNDVLGVTRYKAVFLSWYINHEYDDTDIIKDKFWNYEKELEEWELEKMEKFQLTPGQMHWYHMQYLDLFGTPSEISPKELILQEYPFEPIDAFRTNGNSVFDNELAAKRQSELYKLIDNYIYGKFMATLEYSQDGGLIKIQYGKDCGFTPLRNGVVRIIEKPKVGYPYVAVCDPNRGGKDDTAIQVIDNTNGRQVAVVQTNKMLPDEVATQLYCIASYYNNALVSVEMNGSPSVMDILLKMHYENIYLRQAHEYDDAKKSIRMAYGHVTTKSNRDRMIQSLQIAFRQDPSIITDYNTLEEMLTFQMIESFDRYGNITSSKMEAIGGKHDDLVMALCGFYEVRHQQSAVPDLEIANVKKKKTLYELEEKINNIRSGREEKISEGDEFGILW